MSPEPLHPGDPRQLGDYWLLGRLGAGGQGVVYEGYSADGSRVAVKTLHGRDGDGDGDGDRGGRLFAKEIEAARRVASFCTARILAADLDASPPYVVSEFVPGPTLQQAVRRGGPLDPDALHRLAVGVATALVAIHGAGIVHRDLKPGNVLLGPDGPRVIDFGIARVPDMSRSATGLKGTPRYMAPEVYRGERAGPAVDVWAWGAVVLFAATGTAPFAGNDLPSIAHSVRTHEPDLAVLPEALRGPVGAALAKDPAERPEAREVLLALVGGDGDGSGDGDTGRLLDAGSRAATRVRVPSPGGDGAEESMQDTASLGEIAERAYERLPPEAREAVPALLLRMVVPGEGAADTLRKADESEFDDGLADPPVVERILGVFASAGLLVREDGTVAIASAALLRAWPRLRDWVAAEHDGLPVHHDLADAAMLWDRNGRKSSDLYQGTPLERAMRWAATSRRHAALNRAENAFLDACTALTRRRARLRRLLIGVLSTLLTLLAVATVTVVMQQRTVTRQRDEAVARRLAGRAAELRRSDPRMSRYLALAAARLADLPETRSAVLAASAQVDEDVFTPPGFSPATGAMALAPDGRTLVTADARTVRLWDLDTRRRTRSVPVSVPAAEGVALSPDGTAVAIGYHDGRARLFDVRTGRPLGPEFGEPDPPNTSDVLVEFSPRGGHVLVRTDERLQIWTAGPAPRLVLRRDGRPKTHTFSPDDRSIVLAVTEEFEWWDLTSRRPLPVAGTPLAPADAPGDVAFSPDGRLFARSLADKNGITVTDLTTGRRVAWLFTENEQPLPPVFSPDGAFLADGGRLWRPAAGSAVSGLLMRHRDMEPNCGPTHFGAGALTLRCIRDGRAVVSTDVSAYTRAPVLPGAPEPSEAAFTRDGRLLATLENDRVRVWDVRARRPVAEMTTAAEAIPISPNERFAWSPDGHTLAVVAQDDAGIDIWDVPARRRTGTLSIPERTGFRLRELEFSPDGRSLAALGVDGARLALDYWRVSPARLLRSQHVESSPGRPLEVPIFDRAGLVFAPDGRSVTLGLGGGRRAFPSGARIGTSGTVMEPIQAASADGRLLAVDDAQREVALWDAASLRPTARRLTSGPGQDRTIITSVAFSPDGRMVATGDGAGTVRLWDTANGSPIGGAFTGHSSEVLALAFTRDGRGLLAADDRGIVKEHLIDAGRAAAALCRRYGRGLPEAEWRRHVPEVPYRRTC